MNQTPDLGTVHVHVSNSHILNITGAICEAL